MNVKELEYRIENIKKRFNYLDKQLEERFIADEEAHYSSAREEARELLQMIENKEIEGCGKELTKKELKDHLPMYCGEYCLDCMDNHYCPDCQEKLNNCEKLLRGILE